MKHCLSCLIYYLYNGHNIITQFQILSNCRFCYIIGESLQDKLEKKLLGKQRLSVSASVNANGRSASLFKLMLYPFLPLLPKFLEFSNGFSWRK